MTTKHQFTNTIYLVRHGENPANVTGEFSYKNVDYSLTPKGVLQAQQTAEFFKDKQIDEIYASPLKRARETAAYINESLHLPIHIVEDFREINIGNLELTPPTEETWMLHHRIVQEWYAGLHDVSFPDGEDYHSLLTRMRRGLHTVTSNKSGKNIVIVGHGGIFTRTIQDICPTAKMSDILAIENNNCSVSKLELITEGDQVTGTIQLWASTNHIHGPAADFVPGTKMLPVTREKSTSV